MEPTRRRLMDQVRRTLRVERYSLRTEKSYCYWIRFFIRYSGMRHLLAMGEAEVRAFLKSLAVEGKVAATTQNQTLNAIVFLYAKVLENRALGVQLSRPCALSPEPSHQLLLSSVTELS